MVSKAKLKACRSNPVKHGGRSKSLVQPGDRKVRHLVNEFYKLAPHLREQHRPLLELLSAEIILCRRLYVYLQDENLNIDDFNNAIGNYRGISNGISRALRELKLTPASLSEAEAKVLGNKKLRNLELEGLDNEEDDDYYPVRNLEEEE